MKVFELTNSIDHYWAENSEVIWTRETLSGWRSTSVGDVIAFLENGSTKYYRVEGMGFKMIMLEVH